jgi:predicted MPP superfamily phosphohydrolase
MRRRNFLRGTLATTLGTLVVAEGSNLYVRDVEPNWLDIHEIPVHLTRLDPAFNHYRVAHITDLHTDDTFMTAERLAQIVQAVNKVRAQLVLITGDFVTRLIASSAATLSQLRYLHAPDGVFATLGNHDHWAGPQQVTTLLQANGIQVLKDDLHTIDRGGRKAALHLIGMDDLWTDEPTQSAWAHEDRLAGLLHRVPKEGATLLMVHEPDFADVAAASGRIDLQCSGHSHGGQVRIPFYGSIYLPELARKYQCGMYHIRNLQHYTNRGLGMIDPQVRLNCRPEIAVFELLAAAT